MGESYGVTRASLVAEALTRRRTKVAGVILLSGGFPLEGDVPAAMRNALSLPIWTAAAHTNKKLRARSAARHARRRARARRWRTREGDYASALARVDALSPAERDAVVAQLARFTGLPASQIDAKTLRVTTEQMSNTLLGDDLMVGRYDSRADRTARHERRTVRSDDRSEPEGHPRRHVGAAVSARGARLQERPASIRDRSAAAIRRRRRFAATGCPCAGIAIRRPRTGRCATPAPSRASRPRWPPIPICACSTRAATSTSGDRCYASDYAARHVAPALAPRVTSRVYAGGHATYTDDERSTSAAGGRGRSFRRVQQVTRSAPRLGAGAASRASWR